MKKKLFILIIGLALLLAAGELLAKGPTGSQSISFNKPGQGETIQTVANLCNWAFWIRNDGYSGHNPFTEGSGGTYPRGTATCVYQDGFLWGGKVTQSHFAQPEGSYRVGGQTYTIGTAAGHILTAGTTTTPPVASNPNNAFIYRIRRDWASLEVGQSTVIADAADVFNKSQSAVTDADQQRIIADYKWSWENWPVDLGAPFYDLNHNGEYDPANGETPGIAGADQVIWFVYNDVNPGLSTQLYGAQPIGLEVQTTMWSYNQPGATLGQIIFKSSLLINKSGFPIDSMFVAQWCDPDVGVYTDDLVGCDSVRSLGYAYSGNLTDDDYLQFGLPPAAMGYDFFQGPIVQGEEGDTAIFGLQYRPGYRNLPQYSFGYFAAGSAISDPDLGQYDGTLQWYNLMNGFIPTADTLNPSPFTHGFGELAGRPTKFPVNGDPVANTGDLDAFGTNLPPGDRRMSLSSGPFRMEPGDSQEVVVAIVGGIVAQAGGNNRNAVAQLRLNDDFAQFIFDRLFQGIPSPPATPDVKVTPLEDKITLEWGSNTARVAQTEALDPLLGFNFEGYNIYQYSSVTRSNARKVATFDLANNITQINGSRFVPEFGDIVTVPIQKGTDTGIQRYFVVERDYINDRPLYAGNTYYFAVTAYNAKDLDGNGIVDDDVPEPSLESAAEVLIVKPQSTTPGVVYGGGAGSDLPVDHSSGISDGIAKVVVVDPSRTNGHQYEIFFAEDTDTNSATYGELLWNVMDLTDNNRVIFPKGLPQAESVEVTRDQPIFDGIQVRVSGPAPGVKDWDIPEGLRRFTWVNADFGFEAFNGAIGWSSPRQVFGDGTPGVPASQLKNVLLVLAQVTETVNYNPTFDPADENVSYAYRYGRNFASPAQRPEFEPYIINPSGGYSYQDFTKSVPLSAWDVDDPNNPRRLAVGFMENNQPGDLALPVNEAGGGLVDGKWWPGDFNIFDNVAGGGPREWLWIFDTDYSETPNPDYQTEAIAAPLPVMYWLAVNRRGAVPFSPGGTGADQFLILGSKINTVDDRFLFTAPAVTYSDEQAKKDVEKINVFPNPYYAFNPEESNRFDRKVTFTHLPRKATIRIFSLGGTLVRKIEKDSNDQFQDWDLRNESSLPVASGMYIVHIQLPDLGKEKTLKLFVAQGAEILRFF